MSGRVDPFAVLKEPLPSFTTKPRKDRPVEEEAVARIATENNFPSRQAAPPRASFAGSRGSTGPDAISSSTLRRLPKPSSDSTSRPTKNVCGWENC